MEPPPFDFRSALRRQLLDGMIRKVKPPGGGWKVLVVDREALRILAAAVALDRLVDEGVTIVEMLDLRREPLPRLPAIYFITPSAESIQNLANEDKGQYKEFHLFFTSALPDYQLDVIRSNAAVLRRVKNLVELNINFLVTESRVFSLDRPGASLPQLYGNAAGVNVKESIAEMSLMSERLTDACNLVAPETPWTLRFDAASTVSRTVASLAKEQLDLARMEKASRKASMAPTKAEPDSSAPPGPSNATLLIIDRATDVVSPLMHEFSYQAMAHDLLKLDYRKPGGAHYESKEEDEKGNKKVIPIDDEEKDPIWSHVRHLFVESAHTKAQDALRHFLDNDTAYKIVGKKNSDVDISDMTAAVRNLPESKLRAERHAMHVSVLRECLHLCSSLRLTDVAQCEQDLVIGRHADSTRVRSDEMIETLRGIVEAKDIPLQHRVRTLMIGLAIASAGAVALGGEASMLVTSVAFRNKLGKSGLTDVPGLTSDLIAAIKGLEQMQKTARQAAQQLAARTMPVARPMASNAMVSQMRSKVAERNAYKLQEKETATRRRRQHLDDGAEDPYDVARYVPPIRSVVADLVGDELDSTKFPIAGAVNTDSIISSLGSMRVDEAPMDDIDDDKPVSSKIFASAMKATQAASRQLSKAASRDVQDEGPPPPPDADPDHLYVVFFAGGMCYSEIRAIYEVAEKRKANIVIGGSAILAPSQYLSFLGGVADPVLRINVLMPPLPLELAQTRAAADRTRKAGAAIEKKKKMRAKAAAAEEEEPEAVPVKSSRGAGRSRKEKSPKTVYDRPDDAEVEVVTGVSKKKFARRLFNRK